MTNEELERFSKVLHEAINSDVRADSQFAVIGALLCDILTELRKGRWVIIDGNRTSRKD